jgi:hypothetical protein
MLEFDGINVWAVVVAWLINMVVGAFWYSPAGFAKQWSKLTGVNIMKIPVAEANKIISFVAVSALIQALTLAVILNSLDVSGVMEGLQVGLLLWFGLVTATTVGVTLYQRLGWKFMALNSSYFLVVMTINSVIISSWR